MDIAKVKILALAGAFRKDSFNKKLLRIAAKGAKQAGAQVTEIDLKDFPMPPYDGDIEEDQGLPENAERLKGLMRDHHALLISTPEYNSSIPGAFKNVIDWVSRPSTDTEPPSAAFKGKMALVMSASPGAYGGIQSLGQVRQVLNNIGVIMLPDRIAIPKAAEAFSADGRLLDPKQEKTVEGLGAKLAQVAAQHFPG